MPDTACVRAGLRPGPKLPKCGEGVRDGDENSTMMEGLPCARPRVQSFPPAILSTASCGGYIIIPILYMGKLKLREVKSLGQGNTAVCRGPEPTLSTRLARGNIPRSTFLHPDVVVTEEGCGSRNRMLTEKDRGAPVHCGITEHRDHMDQQEPFTPHTQLH